MRITEHKIRSKPIRETAFIGFCLFTITFPVKPESINKIPKINAITAKIPTTPLFLKKLFFISPIFLYFN